MPCPASAQPCVSLSNAADALVQSQQGCGDRPCPACQYAALQRPDLVSQSFHVCPSTAHLPSPDQLPSLLPQQHLELQQHWQGLHQSGPGLDQSSAACFASFVSTAP